MINNQQLTKGPASPRRASRGGFSLIETLVAVLLLALSIAGPLTIASRGLFSAAVARDRITAFYLAQDAVEYIRYKRDSNRLSSAASWLAGLETCTSADGSEACRVDSIQDQVTTCSTTASVCDVDDAHVLRYNESNGYFTYSAAAGNELTARRFVRSIAITTPVCASGGAPCNAKEAQVAVTVSWEDNTTHTITVRENLFDWQ